MVLQKCVGGCGKTRETTEKEVRMFKKLGSNPTEFICGDCLEDEK